jgi:hypothetical protein
VTGGPSGRPSAFLHEVLKLLADVPITVLARRDDKESSRPPKHHIIKE